jgi:uncharacterized protein (DUF1810 family)
MGSVQNTGQVTVLGERLRVCTAAVNAVTGRTAHQVFGSPR